MNTVPRHLGKYELQQQLGRGSAGEVWKGYDPLVRQSVAIKLIHSDLQSDPNFMTRFTQKGQLLTSLYQPNLVHTREVNIARSDQTNETMAYLVMDYVEGQTLADYINTTSHQGIFPSAEQIVSLFTSLGMAVDYAHQHGFMHGNIKPGNILLARQNIMYFEGGEPQISDFGLAQLLGSTASISSPLYMSPEQARGHAISSRSDIYSLGVILYEICTGVRPFRDESSVAVMMQHINALPTPPNLINSNIPVELSEVILRAMSKDALARYAKASLLAAAIADACSLPMMRSMSNESFAEEEGVYPRSGNTGPILGVSRPTQKLPMNAPISQPRVSGPLTGISGKLPIIHTNPRMPVPPPYAATSGQSGKLPITSATNQTGGLVSNFTQSNKIAVPPIWPQVTQVSPSPVPPQVPLPTPVPPGRTYFTDVTPIYLASAALILLLLVIIGAMGGSMLLKSNNQQATGPKVMAGNIFFLDDALGHNDQVRIEMQNVAAPANGKSYFAWLQNVKGQMQLLGQLSLQNGAISYTYAGNNKHSNLLTQVQSFSITQENSGSTPEAPSGQTAYQAKFDTAILPYLKNILYATPGLPGNQSVVVSLLETIKSMNDKAGSIDDSLQVQPDAGLVRRQATRVIEMIDGTQNAMSSGDLPAKYAPLEHVPIGLFSSPKHPGYLDILATQLGKFKQVAQGNHALLERAQNVENALSDLRTWVQKIRVYDVKILKAAALTDPAIISAALQLKNTAADSYVGHTIPPDAAPSASPGSAGAYQAYIEAQYMAELEVKVA